MPTPKNATVAMTFPHEKWFRKLGITLLVLSEKYVRRNGVVKVSGQKCGVFRPGLGGGAKPFKKDFEDGELAFSFWGNRVLRAEMPGRTDTVSDVSGRWQERVSLLRRGRTARPHEESRRFPCRKAACGVRMIKNERTGKGRRFLLELWDVSS